MVKLAEVGGAAAISASAPGPRNYWPIGPGLPSATILPRSAALVLKISTRGTVSVQSYVARLEFGTAVESKATQPAEAV